MRSPKLFALLTLTAVAMVGPALTAEDVSKPKPLRALLVCGGCCHDYGAQHKILSEGLQARANVVVDVVYSVDKSTKAYFPMYEKADWAKGYDVVIHDECSADIKAVPFVENIVNAHKSIPAVNLHCAMHSYRTGTDLWFKYLGLQSSGHGPQAPIDISYGGADHPITKGLDDWTTINEELYNNVAILEGEPLATGKQTVRRRNGEESVESSVVAWVNEKQGARSFSTTIGHNNETVADDRYLNLLTRGLLWACGKLDDAYLTAYTGEPGKVTQLAPIEAPETKPQASAEKKTVSPEPEQGNYEKEGNSRPSIVTLSAEEEAKILSDVKLGEGLDVSLFATSHAANYPVYVAATPNGDLYVSSDGNGSLGRDPHRGRVVRLRDTDRDGRADEVKEFVKDVDSPRGLVWDHDRLYLVHPPHVSVFIDADGDGVAEKSQKLIDGIAFGFKDRPADHTTNGLTLGIDGWLYIAGGDFGFMDAVGTDGRHVQHRGGGVIRFRPDGSNLEIYAQGTRNILEVAASPVMDIFARDNTNDGGGWDVRFHHFTGGENHGYPRLFRNFNDEIIQPLADYGGGSGCGAVYLSEPGFGGWNDSPLTADWGTGALWKHTASAKGSTFEEPAKPEPMVQMTRPTDGDVDGVGGLYVSSWKGATFKWEGPDVGYIVRVTPKGATPKALPDFEKAADSDLVTLLESPSHRQRMEAQRTLIRRGLGSAAPALIRLANAKDKALPARVAAVYALALAGHSGESLSALNDDEDPLQAQAIRAFPSLATFATLASTQPRVRLETLSALARSQKLASAAGMAGVLGDSDPVVAHTAFRLLSAAGAADVCFSVLDDAASTEASKLGASRALARMHQLGSVDGLISRIEKTGESSQRQLLLAALCRLYFQEGPWKGDSWGTRPDTRGPYYQPEAWEATAKIGAFLNATLDTAPSDEAAFLVNEMSRNRIESTQALDRLLALAKDNPALAPDVVVHLAKADNVPLEGLPFLLAVAKSADATPDQLSQALSGLVKIDNVEAVTATMNLLGKLNQGGGPRQRPSQELTNAINGFLKAPFLENHHQFLEAQATKVDDPTSVWADAALLTLSARKDGSPEAREMSAKALNEGWASPKRRAQILNAVVRTRHMPYADKVIAALDDPDNEVANIARRAVRSLRLERPDNSGPKIAEMKPEDVVAQVLDRRGNPAVGEQLFTKLTCVACHTVSQDEAPKGPYLGNIAQTYKRKELAENILDPNKTIAQGFTSEVFTPKEGDAMMGFVTLESATEVKFRDIAAQEHVLAVSDIAKREKVPTSLMPPGLVANLTVPEFAGLLAYLESLAK